MGHFADGVLHLVDGGHVVEIVRRHAGLLPVEGVYAVVDGHVQDAATPDAGVGGMHPVGGGVVLAAADDLLAADDAVVPGVLQAHAQLRHEGGDDDLVVLIQGEAPHQLARLQGAFPELVGAILVEAQGDGGVVELQAPHGLQHHIGDGVGGVLPGFGVHASQGGVLIGVSDAGGVHQLGGPGPIEAVCLEEEGVHDLLGLIQGDGPGFQVLLQIRPGVLVEPSQGGGGEHALDLDHDLVHHGALDGLPEIPGRVLAEPE